MKFSFLNVGSRKKKTEKKKKGQEEGGENDVQRIINKKNKRF